jgi:protein-disulfide isomerase
MKLNAKLPLLLLVLMFVLGGCVSEKQIKEALVKNPDILTDAIKANPEKFLEAINAAVKDAQKGKAKKRETDEKKKLEESFDKPLVGKIRKDELIRGSKKGVITLIEYSDFECPFCSRGYNVVRSLLKKFPGKIKFVYKHLPLSFHNNAKPASRYYEAIRLQSEKKAIKFHDAIYENQRKLAGGEKFLKKIAKDLDVNMKKLAKDIKGSAVNDRIDADISEAGKFGFQGTPGFLLNGVPVRGAYPIEHFEKIIAELQKRGKLTL